MTICPGLNYMHKRNCLKGGGLTFQSLNQVPQRNRERPNQVIIPHELLDQDGVHALVIIGGVLLDHNINIKGLRQYLDKVVGNKLELLVLVSSLGLAERGGEDSTDHVGGLESRHRDGCVRVQAKDLGIVQIYHALDVLYARIKVQSGGNDVIFAVAELEVLIVEDGLIVEVR